MNEKFKRMKGQFSAGSSKNFSVYGTSSISNINEKAEALKIAKEMHKKRLENIVSFVEKQNSKTKEENKKQDVPVFENISDEELKKRIEYSKKKNKEVIENGLNESSDLSETLDSIVKDLFN
jgi:hypothetical protein